MESFRNSLNYIRAEILYRLGINPFTIANEISIDDLNNLLNLCHLCCRDSYSLGGGQLKDWHNPYGTEGRTFKDWIKCYSVPGMESLTDKTGRRFWYDPKWKE